jgi:hypothetical protein
VAGVVVTNYVDYAEGWMQETPDGAGQFTRVLLRPKVTIAGRRSGEGERVASRGAPGLLHA